MNTASTTVTDVESFIRFMLKTQEYFYKCFKINRNRLEFFFCIMSIFRNGIDIPLNGEHIPNFIEVTGISEHRFRKRLIELEEMKILELQGDRNYLSKINVRTTNKYKMYLEEFSRRLKEEDNPLLLNFEGNDAVRYFDEMWERIRYTRRDLIDDIVNIYWSSSDTSSLKKAVKAKLRLDADFWYVLFLLWLKERERSHLFFTLNELNSEIIGGRMPVAIHFQQKFLKLCSVDLCIMQVNINKGSKTYFFHRDVVDLLTYYAEELKVAAERVRVRTLFRKAK